MLVPQPFMQGNHQTEFREDACKWATYGYYATGQHVGAAGIANFLAKVENIGNASLFELP